MTDYKYKIINAELTTCDCCQSPAPIKTFQQHKHPGGPFEVEDVELCEVCSGTMIGTAHEYPEQYENAQLYFALAFCTNLILDAVTGRRPK